MTEKTVIIKLQTDDSVIIEIYDQKKNLLCINFAKTLNDSISVLNLLFSSQVIIKEAG